MTRTRDKLLTGRGGGDDHTQSKMKHTQSKYEIHMYFQKFYNVYICTTMKDVWKNKKNKSKSKNKKREENRSEAVDRNGRF